MNKVKRHLFTALSTSLIAITFCLQSPLMARADNMPNLLAESPAMDTTTAVQQRLFGSAKQTDAAGDASTDATGTAQAPSHLFNLAAKKLSMGTELSADEYRALGVGITGLEIHQTFFQNKGEIEGVYEGSPADLAGIKVGDKVVNLHTDADSEAREAANPTQPLYQVTFKRVGVPVTITLVRHKKEVPIELITYNIEDIKDDKTRHMFEQMISHLGFPKEGKFTGTSIKELTGGN